MEFKTDALLLRAADYGENDKIVTLLTSDRGKLTAGMRGVKKAGAKLRFAAQPFCFAEYLIAHRGVRNTVISASLYDGFFSLREDVGVYYASACVLELCDKLVLEGMESGAFLLAAVSALKEMGENPAFILLKFMLKALELAGYPVRTRECGVCGKELLEPLYFDFSEGTFVCSSCATGTRASGSTYRAIRCAYGLEGESEQDGVVRALRLLRAYFNTQTELDIPTLGEFLII